MTMVKQDTKNMVLVSEDMLLKELVLSHDARTTVKNMLDARNKLSFPFNVTWSSDEKEWLFSSLVIKIAEIPAKARSPEDLRVFLAERPDAPQFAFKTIQLANLTMNGKQLVAFEMISSGGNPSEPVWNPSIGTAGHARSSQERLRLEI